MHAPTGLFRCQHYAKKTRAETIEQSGTLAAALADAHSEKTKNANVVIITRNSQGKDHPDNAGMFFLYQIIK